MVGAVTQRMLGFTGLVLVLSIAVLGVPAQESIVHRYGIVERGSTLDFKQANASARRVRTSSTSQGTIRNDEWGVVYVGTYEKCYNVIFDYVEPNERGFFRILIYVNGVHVAVLKHADSADFCGNRIHLKGHCACGGWVTANWKAILIKP